MARDLVDYLNEVDYNYLLTDYKPSQFALEFITFIKLVNGTEGEEHPSPVIHYDMIDQLLVSRQNLFVSFRGSAKTSLIHEYMFLYLATYGRIPGFGEVDVAMYISDTIDNGVKSMRTNLQYRWTNSEFLQRYVPETRFTDVRWEFQNIEGKKLCVRGFGASALPLDALLYTDTGFTTMGEVSVGDTIYAPSGLPCKVVEKSEIFNSPMYRLTFSDGRTIDVSDDHVNNLWFHFDRSVKGVRYTGYEERNILTRDLLNVSLNRGTLYKVRLRNTAPVAYTHKDFSIAPYVLGVLLGDGNVTKTKGVRICGLAEDVDYYRTEFSKTEETSVVYCKEKSGTSMARLSLLKATARLGAMNLRGVLGECKFVPEEYMRGSVEQRKELLAGLLDTDGNCSKDSRVTFSNVSKVLVDSVVELVRSLGGTATICSYPDREGNRKGLFVVYIRTSFNPFKLPRKAALWVHAERYTGMVNLVGIEEIQSVPSQCIAVDSEDNLYLTKAYVGTHNTGVRGFKEYGKRPTWSSYDDLMSDKNAESATITRDIKHIIYKAARQALHPSKRMQLWTGTPFNKSDPLYEATEGSAWNVRVYPICEKFPCTKEEFRGAWEDRFGYDFVKAEYESLLASGEIASFNQELMLRISSDEDRLVQDHDLVWYERKQVMKDRSSYNFYITTDLATSDQDKSDFSVIGVWAYSSNHDWLLVDGICARQLMDKSIDELFRFVSMYKPLSVGIEINGQQGGFIQWLKGEMIHRKIFFSFAGKKGIEGIRRTRPKIEYLKTFLPVIKTKKVWLPEEMKDSSLLQELVEELRYVTTDGFKSRNDDASDMLTMLQEMDPFAPSAEVAVDYLDNEDGTFAFTTPERDDDLYKNSLVF